MKNHNIKRSLLKDFFIYNSGGIMKITLFIFLIHLAIFQKAVGQTYTTPSNAVPCTATMMDAYNSNVQSFREDIRRSAFRYKAFGNCTGTLINRNTGEGSLGTYFVTSWHCFKSAAGDCGGVEYDFGGTKVEFYFNFQSPPSQLGKVFYDNYDGKKYYIEAYVRLVDHVVCAYGDFAICEILGNPIPPHFNVYYAGWSPAGISPMDDYLVYSHPNGSIKQAAKTNYVQDGYRTFTVEKSCKLVAKVTDFLVGWVWGRKWSTQEICQYVQIPFLDTRLIAKQWIQGNLEGGSSGSALFNGNNRIKGTYSGAYYDCEPHQDFWFGNLSDYYTRQTIKNTMNPQDKWAVDEMGIPGRNRSCYQSIDYNSYGKSFNLYPAGWYQSQNEIAINAATTVVLGGSYNVTVKNGADFIFNAGNSLQLNPGFTAEAGSTFIANAGVSCSYGGAYRTDGSENNYEALAKEELYARMQAIEIPDHLDLLETGLAKGMTVSVFPNPASDIITIRSSFLPGEKLNVAIIDVMGIELFNETFDSGIGSELRLPIKDLKNGLYQIVFKSGNESSSQKIVIQR